MERLAPSDKRDSGKAAPPQAVSSSGLFLIGPDQEGDLRLLRPYFLIPLEERDEEGKTDYDRSTEARKAALDRVREWVRQSAASLGSPLLHPSALKDPRRLLERLCSKNDDYAVHLKRQFSCDTERRLQRFCETGQVSPSLLGAVLRDLNAALREECFFGPQLVTALHAPFPEPLRAWVAEHLANGDEASPLERMEINRYLLEHWCPEGIAARQPRGPITDVYVLSHGWHRNLYGAVAAYDQLASRIAILLRQSRLPCRPGYHPLFLTLHWHSDPGQDGWVDRAGRRSKASFLELAERLFERPSTADEQHTPPKHHFICVFEELYQFFARMSAPDTHALQGNEGEARRLAGLLDLFALRDAPGATLDEKVAAAWGCYHRAAQSRALVDQNQPPGRFLGVGSAVMNLATFVVGAFTLAALLGLLFKNWQSLWGVRDLIAFVGSLEVLLNGHWLERLAAEGIPEWLRGAATWIDTKAAWAGGAYVTSLLLAIPAWFALQIKALWAKDRRARPPAPWQLFAWVLLEVPLALPLLVYSLVTYFLGGLLMAATRSSGSTRLRHTLLFDERLGDRDELIDDVQKRRRAPYRYSKKGKLKVNGLSPRYRLAWLARYPMQLLYRGLSEGHPGVPALDGLRNQLAFWEMQMRGVEAGRHASWWLSNLFSKPVMVSTPNGPVDALAGARIHFAGHSFGGLVLSNALRHLVLDPATDDFRKHGPGKIHSLCLLQAAIASNWFEGERSMLAAIRGSLACVYSRYDTANSFYYPMANHGRLAAGWVGLLPRGGLEVVERIPDPEKTTDRGVFSALVGPPELATRLTAPTVGSAYVLNLDASRMIFDGPITSGGGHGDIFKDDVIYLLWDTMALDQTSGTRTAGSDERLLNSTP